MSEVVCREWELCFFRYESWVSREGVRKNRERREVWSCLWVNERTDGERDGEGERLSFLRVKARAREVDRCVCCE